VRVSAIPPSSWSQVPPQLGGLSLLESLSASAIITDPGISQLVILAFRREISSASEVFLMCVAAETLNYVGDLVA
jgi:hypothetical protein